jgi:indole-3-glycerol phosphate synthase
MSARDYLTAILERKRRENIRRARHHFAARTSAAPHLQRMSIEQVQAALRRAPGTSPRVIAEIKRKSPSAGVLRAAARGDVEWLAREYVQGGAAAISVLCDREGFGGSVLDLRRAARAVEVPVLFKEFVLDERQVALAAQASAQMILLIVRALPRERLHALCDAAIAAGLAPVVEAADGSELEIALQTRAQIIGVNARNLKTFAVDPQAAQQVLARIPRERIAVHMSGIHKASDYQQVSEGRADAVLIGESLMRAERPSLKLRELQAAGG